MVNARVAISRRRALKKNKGFGFLAAFHALLKNPVFFPEGQDSFFDFVDIKLIHDILLRMRISLKRNFGFWILIFIFSVDLIINVVWHWSAALDNRYPWFDISMHLLGGVGVSLVLKQYFSKSLSYLPQPHQVLFLISATLLVGVLWEFAEFFTTQIRLREGSSLRLIGNLEDTLTDLLMDMLGAATVTSPPFLHSFWKRKP